jgi:hypothetical protein
MDLARWMIPAVIMKMDNGSFGYSQASFPARNFIAFPFKFRMGIRHLRNQGREGASLKTSGNRLYLKWIFSQQSSQRISSQQDCACVRIPDVGVGKRCEWLTL